MIGLDWQYKVKKVQAALKATETERDLLKIQVAELKDKIDELRGKLEVSKRHKEKLLMKIRKDNKKGKGIRWAEQVANDVEGIDCR